MTRDQTIVVVEDDPHIADLLDLYLRDAGFRVVQAADGERGLELIRDQQPLLAILDVGLPGAIDGMEVCRRVRSGPNPDLPVLILTARAGEIDRVLGLELGADDYLCKPFSMRELVARVRVLFRRIALNREPKALPAADTLTLGALTLDFDRHLARWKGAVVSLTVTEFLIVAALARRPGHVRSRKQLLEEGYPHDAYVSERTIDSHVKRLRAKFAELDPTFAAIDTVHGLGYRYREDAP
jgi:two-component system, OmpR family, response regulator ChvI